MKPMEKGGRDGAKSESANGLSNVRGTMAMYRELGRPNSAPAEFFINAADNLNFDALDDGAGYTVFGTVVEGLDTVDKIAGVSVGPHPAFAAGRSPVVPVEPVVLRNTKVLTPLDPEQAQAAVIATEREAVDRKSTR